IKAGESRPGTANRYPAMNRQIEEERLADVAKRAVAGELDKLGTSDGENPAEFRKRNRLLAARRAAAYPSTIQNFNDLIDEEDNR
ncbi:MAG: hypothetical protein AAF907_17600, partial [Planctomycetota bacterium]